MTNTINLKNIEKVVLPQNVIEAIEYLRRNNSNRLYSLEKIEEHSFLPNTGAIHRFITTSEENFNNYTKALVVGYVPEKTKEEIEAEKKEAAIVEARKEYNKKYHEYMAASRRSSEEGFANGYRAAFHYLVDRGLVDSRVTRNAY